MTDLDEEWQKLCEEHRSALDAVIETSAPVKQKVTCVVQGISNFSPLVDEVDQFNAASESLQSVRNRMNDFIKENT